MAGPASSYSCLDPHALEGGQRRQDRATNPDTVHTLIRKKKEEKERDNNKKQKEK